ncbi:hypothetical protein [Thermoplasma acidophilum]|uniref:hypothetical protein n=1 Tax=Thermoplasma acidophilum TaxID=2303 RepID=UPI001F51F8D4|nr:hypothetical protein [Thermoplasma acidophilum]
MDSLLIINYKITKGKIHVSCVSHHIIDSVRNCPYVLADSVYDILEKYDFAFDNACHYCYLYEHRGHSSQSIDC